jgi:hypothetical protein
MQGMQTTNPELAEKRKHGANTINFGNTHHSGIMCTATTKSLLQGVTAPSKTSHAATFMSTIAEHVTQHWHQSAAHLPVDTCRK